MATRGRSVSITTSYQTAFDSTTDGGPATFATIYAFGNDVTIQVTYAGTKTDETLVASGQSLAVIRDFTGGARPELITKVEVKAATAAGTAYVAAGPRA